MKALTDLLAVGNRIRYTQATPNPNFRGLIGTITSINDTSAVVKMDPNNQGAEGDHLFLREDGLSAWGYIEIIGVTIREETDLTDIL